MNTELARQEALLRALLGREDPHAVRQTLAGLGLRGVQFADVAAGPTEDRAGALAVALAGEQPGAQAGGQVVVVAGVPADGSARSELQDLDAGLRAYRGNAVALSERALAGAFPHLAAQLGAQFASLAWTFWCRCPPAVGDLGAWGGALPDFLRETADDTLAGVAAFEWALHQVERAPDAALDTASLSLLNGDPAALGLVLRPGLVVLELSEATLMALAGHRAWLSPAQLDAVGAERPDGTGSDQSSSQASSQASNDGGRLKAEVPGGASEAVLVWRKDWRGRATHLRAAEAVFMRSALAGDSIETALSNSASASVVNAARAGEVWDFTVFLQQALQEQWLLAVRRLDAANGEEECNDGPEPQLEPQLEPHTEPNSKPDVHAGLDAAAPPAGQCLSHGPG